MLTHNIDLRDWLEKAAEKQAQEQGPAVHALIAGAAAATEQFSDDELEEAAAKERCK